MKTYRYAVLCFIFLFLLVFLNPPNVSSFSFSNPRANTIYSSAADKTENSLHFKDGKRSGTLKLLKNYLKKRGKKIRSGK